MVTMLAIVLVVVVALVVGLGVLVWYWTWRRPLVGVLAEELVTRARMDALTRQTAQAMRDAVRTQQGKRGGWAS